MEYSFIPATNLMTSEMKAFFADTYIKQNVAYVISL